MTNILYWYILIGFGFAVFLKMRKDIEEKIFLYTTFAWPFIAIGYFGRKIFKLYMKKKTKDKLEELDSKAEEAIENLQENE